MLHTSVSMSATRYCARSARSLLPSSFKALSKRPHPPLIVIAFRPRCLNSTRRMYATIGGGGDKGTNSENSDPSEMDKEILRLIHEYPESIHATPYEVLNLPRGTDMKPSALKKRFFQLAKIYHPDSTCAHGYPLSQHAPEMLNAETKDDRFKKILAAYTLLKNPISKANYDKFDIGWNDGTNLRTSPNMYNPGSPMYHNFNRSQKSNFTSYETGTWEDRYRHGYENAYGFSADRSWNSSKTGDFKEEFAKNRNTILLSVALMFVVYGALQMTHLYLYDDLLGEHYNKSTSSENVSIHEKSEDDLFHAYTNYGLGDTKQDRINRFLWWRKLTMTFNLAEVREVLDHFYKKGIVESSTEEEAKLKKFNSESHSP